MSFAKEIMGLDGRKRSPLVVRMQVSVLFFAQPREAAGDYLSPAYFQPFLTRAGCIEGLEEDWEGLM